MIPAILGLGGLTAKIIASAVIPRVVRAISSSFSTTKANEPCPPPAVEGISSVSDTPPVPPGSGVFVPRESLRKWGYAGLWHHAASGLDLATYRAYDAANKRWISRDPLGEGIDYNLYRYCGNSPVMLNDPEGLQPPEFDDGGYSGARDSFRNAVHNGVQTVETTGRRAGEFGIDMVGDPTDPTTWWTFFVSEEKLMWKVEQALLKWKKKLNRAKKCTDALNTVEGAQDQLESIQHAQNKLRKGKASGIVIDSIQKSTDRLRNSLKNRYQR